MPHGMLSVRSDSMDEQPTPVITLHEELHPAYRKTTLVSDPRMSDHDHPAVTRKADNRAPQVPAYRAHQEAREHEGKRRSSGVWLPLESLFRAAALDTFFGLRPRFLGTLRFRNQEPNKTFCSPDERSSCSNKESRELRGRLWKPIA